MNAVVGSIATLLLRVPARALASPAGAVLTGVGEGLFMHEALADRRTPHALALCAFALRLAVDRALGAGGVYLGLVCMWTALGALLAELVSPAHAHDTKSRRRRRYRTTTTEALTPGEVEALERAHRERLRREERAANRRTERVQFISPVQTETPPPGEVTPLPTPTTLESSDFIVSTDPTSPLSAHTASPIRAPPQPVIPPPITIHPRSRSYSDLSPLTASPTASRSSSTLTPESPHSPSPPPRPIPAPPPVLSYRLESRSRRPSLTTVPEESTIPSSGQTRTDPDVSREHIDDDDEEHQRMSPVPDEGLDVGSLGRVRLAKSGLLLVPPGPAEGSSRAPTPSDRDLEVVEADEESDELQTPQTRYLVVRDQLETPRVTDEQLPTEAPRGVSVSYPLPAQSSAAPTEAALTEIDDSEAASEISTGGLFGPTIEKADRLREEARAKYDEARQLEFQARTANRQNRPKQAFILRREAEAASRCAEKLDAQAERRYFHAFWEVLKRNGRQLKVIVGKGRHSSNGVPSLKPSIIKHMEE
ncbi:hypothetical protein HDZ31DRAFT_82403 [Schizophyllum fasciatum]